MLKLKRVFIALICLYTLNACNLAPKHQPKLPLPMPQEYQEAGPWTRFKSRLSLDSKKPWWLLFQDPCLTHLEEELSLYNFDLKVALSRYDE